MQTLTIRGLPHRLAQDGWWLTSAETGGAEPTRTVRRSGASRRGLPGVLALLGLAALADLLFWSHAPGISVAIFAGAVFAVSVSGLTRRAWLRPALLLLLAALPVIEYAQALSLAFLAGGLILALVWSRLPEAAPAAIGPAALAFAHDLPSRWVEPLRPRTLRRVARTTLPAVNGTALRGRLLRDWAFPVGGTLVFSALLLEANPALQRLLSLDLDAYDLFRRALFWTGIAVLVFPFLSIPLGERDRAAWTPRLPGLGINPGSVLRALAMFNLLIAVQVVTDVSILVGGAALPEGMSYADYAHRGAYPLLATAILAGAFALVANPFLAEHRAIRPLMLLWLAQNLVICGAAALRLDLYIDVYGLTYLRIQTLIWMGLVAAGLTLSLWQVARGRPNRWLLLRTGALALLTLYACCFVNFAGIIAAGNLPREQVDLSYVCGLDRTAAAAIRTASTGHDRLRPMTCPASLSPRIDGWQEWGYRKWRVARYVAATDASKWKQ